MRFALMIEAQMGLSYDDQLAIVRRAEAAGFEAFFRSDHYASFPGSSEQASTDTWAVLAGLARETSTIHLGSLVSPVTFRHPGNFVKVVTTVDEMSGGRIEVGVGAGWNDDDHLPLGLPYPEIKERADLMEDQLALLHGLWEEAPGWDFDGHVIRVRGGVLRPGPVQVEGRPIGKNGRFRPRILTGSEGSPRGYRIAAKYCDEFNFSSSSPDSLAEKQTALDEACRAIGRDPRSLTRSTMAGALIGRDQAQVEARAASLMTAFGQDEASGVAWLDARRNRWIFGTPDQARAMVARYEAAGIERIMLQDFLPHDLGMIDMFAEELIAKA
ncbi:MAG TPA: LLM class flavin-dependent oxidoreductase [Candidatus Limnocylindrales bacterium]|nr:LLM class flavin-dependent oxidoreductase [Candidatus Limnocylindrales bacterium]